ncbi:MAG: acyl-CoA dehydratase activase [Candidatus Cloacimonadia bacterium]
MNTYLGIDVGSISTNLVLIDEQSQILSSLYLWTEGNPIKAVKDGMRQIKEVIDSDVTVKGVGTTGSGRHLAGAIVGADLIKNEITAHAMGARFFVPEVQTVIEIGGQDSKIIILEDGVVVDFGMNTICAAGTGSFLDNQAARLRISIEQFGNLALQSQNPTTIASRCTVFAESDMIHKQQIGHKIEDIVAGLCHGLARNYLSSVAHGKNIKPPIVFQGGVSKNEGMKWAFEQELHQKIIIPEYSTVMGAFGVALGVKDLRAEDHKPSRFRGWNIAHQDISCTSFHCDGCPNHCEVVKASIQGKVISYWGDRCGKWSNIISPSVALNTRSQR